MEQQQLQFEQRVDDRIAALLARCDAIRRGSEISRPHVFNAAGEAHARSVAERDQETNRG